MADFTAIWQSLTRRYASTPGDTRWGASHEANATNSEGVLTTSRRRADSLCPGASALARTSAASESPCRNASTPALSDSLISRTARASFVTLCATTWSWSVRSEEHTSELQSLRHL